MVPCCSCNQWEMLYCTVLSLHLKCSVVTSSRLWSSPHKIQAVVNIYLFGTTHAWHMTHVSQRARQSGIDPGEQWLTLRVCAYCNAKHLCVASSGLILASSLSKVTVTVTVTVTEIVTVVLKCCCIARAGLRILYVRVAGVCVCVYVWVY